MGKRCQGHIGMKDNYFYLLFGHVTKYQQLVVVVVIVNYTFAKTVGTIAVILYIYMYIYTQYMHIHTYHYIYHYLRTTLGNRGPDNFTDIVQYQRNNRSENAHLCLTF